MLNHVESAKLQSKRSTASHVVDLSVRIKVNALKSAGQGRRRRTGMNAKCARHRRYI